MINDSVREELALKISPRVKPLKKIIEENPAPIEKPAKPLKISLTVEPSEPVLAIEPEKKPVPTEKLPTRPTSPILVEFQNKNAVIPEWRLQLQNSVRRRAISGSGAQTTVAVTVPQKVLQTSGATALKSEPVEQSIAVPASGNPTLEKALRRIEESRQKYLVEEKQKPLVFPAQPRTFPHIVSNKAPVFPATKFQDADNAIAVPAPKAAFIFSPVKVEKFNTNKLPPIPEKISSSFEKVIEIPSTEIKSEDDETFLNIKADQSAEVQAYAETTFDEIADSEPEIVESEDAELEGDDRAPLMMRFNAGFFDLIIGAFTSFILLAPFTLASGNLFTFQGLLAFLATCSIVMFIYLTTSIGMMGRTLGMKIFSLEIVDIRENAYPTFHQAAVSSSVYLVSLALGGVGFLTLFLNDENRAAHDLISGTIIVKECE